MQFLTYGSLKMATIFKRHLQIYDYKNFCIWIKTFIEVFPKGPFDMMDLDYGLWH